MTLRRLSFATFVFALVLGSAAAQELSPELVSEAISNWSAPPFWAPQRTLGLEKLEASDELEPMAVETVPTGALPFFGITPCRLVDTTNAAFGATYGPPALIADTPRSFDLNSQPNCPGIPAGAEAYSLNITAAGTQGPGFIVIYPQGGAIPVASTLNYVGGQTIANAAIVPAGTNGGVTVIAGTSGTHLIIDVNGYYAPQTVVNTVNGLSGTVTLAPGTNVTITPSGQTLTIAASGGAPAWSLTGNSGTTPGTNFLGTTDNQALELKVNGARAFRLEPTLGVPNVIGGFNTNSVTPGVVGATIAGGGRAVPGFNNLVTDDYGTIGGGFGNRAGDGDGPTTDKENATVGGGVGNIASGFESTVGGGAVNVASGFAATVPGGLSNTALGSMSFAAGSRAKANHDGTFVWGDTTLENVASTSINQFIVRASGGIWLGTTSSPSLDIATNFLTTSTGARLTIGGVWTNNSDQDSKENFQEIDEHDVLSRVATLPITRWNYKAEGCEVEHIGPMAQDFAAAFGVGSDDRSIGTLDSSGVALAAIQALYAEVQELRKRLAALEAGRD